MFHSLVSDNICWTQEYYTAKEFFSYFRYCTPIVVKMIRKDEEANAVTGGEEQLGTVRYSSS